MMASEQNAPENGAGGRAGGKQDQKLKLMAIIGGVVIVGGIAFLMWPGGINIYPNQVDFGSPDELFPVGEIPVPKFPEPKPFKRGGGGEDGPTVVVTTVDCGSVPENKDAPGMAMKMRVYIPEFDAQDPTQKVSCVLFASAGANLVTGKDMDEFTFWDPELEPYLMRGFAVVHYSVDGGWDMDNGSDAELRKAYLKFRAAAAGVVNGRNALEFAIQHPRVDPDAIYCAGHSSAANVAILLAQHDSRIKGCLAYAPSADVEERLAELGDQSGAWRVLPKHEEFLKQSNPMTHIDKIQCPIVIFHSMEDEVCPFEASEKFVKQAMDAGKNAKLEALSGGHYESMVSRGLRYGGDYLTTWRQQARKASAAQNAEG